MKQPLHDPSTGSVLCWNGEAWRINDLAVQGNDAEAVFALLSSTKDQNEALDVLRSVDGPFAFAYFDGDAKKLIYGRDRLGRRSLLVKGSEYDEGEFCLSSVADDPGAGWTEVQADGIYVMDLASRSRTTERCLWTEDEKMVSTKAFG